MSIHTFLRNTLPRPAFPLQGHAFAVGTCACAALFACSLPTHAQASQALQLSDLPAAVQSQTQAALARHWPGQTARISAIRKHAVAPEQAMYLLQVDGRGFLLLSQQGQNVKLAGYGLQGGEDLYPADGSLDLWLHAMGQQLLHTPPAASEPAADPAAFSTQRAELAAGALGPFLRSNWGQSGFYNDSTPPDGNTVPTGCVATALAQAMRYYQHPLQPKKTTISYNHQTTTADGKPFSYGVLSADLSRVEYRWQEMPEVVASKNPQVADLMYHLGVSLKMRYRPGFSSNAYFDDIAPAMRNQFGYHISNQLFRSQYSTQAWQQMIDGQLEEQKIVVMCGYDYDKGAGHCWVVDGRDAQNFYHMNWGWDGRFNGYFALDQPAVMGYNFAGYNHIFTLQPSCLISPRHEVLADGKIKLSNAEYALRNDYAYRRAGESAWQNAGSSAGSLELSQLQPASEYEYKISSQCSSLGQGESAVQRFTTPVRSYCRAQGQNSQYEWIAATQINGRWQSSGNNQGYADFSANPLPLSAGAQGYALNLALNPGYSSGNYLLYWTVWLDSNQDGQFGSGELLWQTRAAGNQQVNLTLPAQLAAGNYRLRILMSYYPQNTACDALQYGEVEDYGLSLQR